MVRNRTIIYRCAFGGDDLEKEYYSVVRQLNTLAGELDMLYHCAARRFDIPDSVLRILYAVCELGDGCLLSDVCRNAGITKQTVNSALRRLESDGILYLEADGKKSKRVYLSAAGHEYVERTAIRLLDAEARAVSCWSEEEVSEYLRLMNKYIGSLGEQIKLL